MGVWPLKSIWLTSVPWLIRKFAQPLLLFEAAQNSAVCRMLSLRFRSNLYFYSNNFNIFSLPMWTDSYLLLISSMWQFGHFYRYEKGRLPSPASVWQLTRQNSRSDGSKHGIVGCILWYLPWPEFIWYWCLGRLGFITLLILSCGLLTQAVGRKQSFIPKIDYIIFNNLCVCLNRYLCLNIAQRNL